MSIHIDATKGCMKKGTRDRSSLAGLHAMRRVVLCRWLLGVIPPEIKGRALPSNPWVCWLAFLVANHAEWANMADGWVRFPPEVSGVSCGLGDERARMLSMPCMIPGVGLKRSPPCVTSVFPMV
jgi:hypothetical protein